MRVKLKEYTRLEWLSLLQYKMSFFYSHKLIIHTQVDHTSLIDYKLIA